jgi:hypothetical protein
MKNTKRRIMALLMAVLMVFGTFSTALADFWTDFDFGFGTEFGAIDPQENTIIYDMQEDSYLFLLDNTVVEEEEEDCCDEYPDCDCEDDIVDDDIVDDDITDSDATDNDTVDSDVTGGDVVNGDDDVTAGDDTLDGREVLGAFTDVHPTLVGVGGTIAVDMDIDPRTITITDRIANTDGISIRLGSFDLTPGADYMFEVYGTLGYGEGATVTLGTDTAETMWDGSFELYPILSYDEIMEMLELNPYAVLNIGGTAGLDLVITGIVITEFYLPDVAPVPMSAPVGCPVHTPMWAPRLTDTPDIGNLNANGGNGIRRNSSGGHLAVVGGNIHFSPDDTRRDININVNEGGFLPIENRTYRVEFSAVVLGDGVLANNRIILTTNDSTSEETFFTVTNAAPTHISHTWTQTTVPAAGNNPAGRLRISASTSTSERQTIVISNLRFFEVSTDPILCACVTAVQSLAQAAVAARALFSAVPPTFVATNATVADDIFNLVDGVITNNDITAAWSLVAPFNKVDATLTTAGSVTGTIVLSEGGETENIIINLVIAALNTTDRLNAIFNTTAYTSATQVGGFPSIIGTDVAVGTNHATTGWFFSNVAGGTAGSQGSGIRVFPTTFPCRRGTADRMLALQLNTDNNNRAYNVRVPVPITANTGTFGIAFDYFYSGIQGPSASAAPDPNLMSYIIGLSNTSLSGNTVTPGTVGDRTRTDLTPAPSPTRDWVDDFNGHLRIFNNRVTLVNTPNDNIATGTLRAGWNTVYALIDTNTATDNVRWFATPTMDAPSFQAFAQGTEGTLSTWNPANPINSISFMTHGAGSATVLNLSRLHVFEYLNTGMNGTNYAGPVAPFVPCNNCSDCIPVTGIAPLLFNGENTLTISAGEANARVVPRPVITPAGAGQDVTWYSSNPAVATVTNMNGNGRVVGISVGTAEITVTTVGTNADGDNLVSSILTVTVQPDESALLAEWVFNDTNYPNMPTGNNPTTGTPGAPGALVLPASGGTQAGSATDRESAAVRLGTTLVAPGTAVMRRVFDTAEGVPSGSQTARHFTFGASAPLDRLLTWSWTQGSGPDRTAWVQLEVSTLGASQLALSYEMWQDGGSAPAIMHIDYSLNNGATWTRVVTGMGTVTTSAAERARFNYLPEAMDNQASVWIRFYGGPNNSGSGNISFRNIELLSGIAPPPACCPENDCGVCRPNIFVYPFPFDVRPSQSDMDGALRGWEIRSGSGSEMPIPVGNPSMASANVRYLVFEFTENPGPWAIYFQDNSWRQRHINYSTISQQRTVLDNGNIRYVIDFDSAIPPGLTTNNAAHAGYTSSALFGTFQISFGGTDLSFGNWDDFASRIQIAYITNVHPRRHPNTPETEIATWASIAAHGGDVVNTNLLQVSTAGAGGLKLYYDYVATGAGLNGVRLQYSIDGGTTWRNIHRAFSIINTPLATNTGSRMEVLPLETYDQANLQIRWIPHGPWGNTPWGTNQFTVTNVRLTTGLQISDVRRATSPVIGISSLVGQDITLDAGGATANVTVPTVTLIGGTSTDTAWSSSAPTTVNVSTLTETQATLRSFGTDGTAVIRVAASADPSIFTEFNVTVEEVLLDPTIQFLITSPYAGVNWNWTQYRAAHHNHTTQSDGTHTVASAAERHWELGYHVVAFTEHNVATVTPNQATSGAMTTERIAQMAAGTGRAGHGSGMLFIPGGNEHGLQMAGFSDHHMNTYWTGGLVRTGSGETIDQLVGRMGDSGLARINHPGRYTGSQHPVPRDLAESIARNPANFLPYANQFRRSHSLIGMEIINKFDTESQADRILWDNILSVTMNNPIPMPVWGFSDDDAHHNNNIGFSFNLLLMPELSLSEVRNSMDMGTFFAFSRTDRQYGIRPSPMQPWFWPNDSGADGAASQPVLSLPMPRINSITTGNNSITINASMVQSNGVTPSTAANFNACVATCAAICLIHPAFIHWYADGVLIAKGSTLDLYQHQLSIGSYVRASVGHRSYGVLYTQPFEVQVVHAEGSDIAPRAIPNLTGIVQIPQPNLTSNPSAYELETQILPAAIRINTTAADNTTHPRFATISWDLSRYNPAAPSIDDILGRVMLPTGIKRVTNTNNIDLNSIFVGVGCGHNNWGDWEPVAGEEATCELPGRERRTCQTASCDGVQFQAVPALGHDWGDWVLNIPSAGQQTRTCQNDGCDVTHTIDIPPCVCNSPTCTECNPPTGGSVVIWELNITPALITALNNRDEYGGMASSGLPTLSIVGGNLVVSNRVGIPGDAPAGTQPSPQEWSSVDVLLKDLQLTPGGNYRITVVGDAGTGAFSLNFPLCGTNNTWHYGGATGTSTGVTMTFNGTVPTLNGATQPDSDGGHRIRILTGGTGTFTITSIVIERIGAGGGGDTNGGGTGGDNVDPGRPDTTVQGTPARPPSGGTTGGATGGEGGEEGPGEGGLGIEVIDVVVEVDEDELQELVENGEDLEIEADGIVITIPADVLAALMAEYGFEDFSVEIVVTRESGTTVISGGNVDLLTISVGLYSGDEEIVRLPGPITVSVSLEDFDLSGVNPHRIVAVLEDGTIIGGSFDPETGLFTFETEIAGTFTITYVQSLIRLNVALGSSLITCLADNAPMQVMDVLPVVENGRTLLPIRFLSNALGGDIGWDDDAKAVTLSIDGRTLTFAIGEMAPGMDVPAMLIDGRTMVPARFIAEFFGAIVTWDDATRSFEIIM